MGNSQSSPLQTCLTSAVGGNTALVAFPSSLLYQINDVRPYNLDYPLTPAAVTYPTTTDQISKIIKCAVDANVKVQPRSGGHSYANYGLGGTDGAVVVDMKNFQKFSMDQKTWQATVGAGTLLGDLSKKLHDNGNRVVAHGTCPQVGIGGHATIGGLGPASRMWGALLDHIEEVEVVLANSTVVRASTIENSDLFFALRGAAAGFGIITEFKLRTQQDPGEIVQYSFSFSAGSHESMADTFKAWQTFISNPKLSRKFASQAIIFEIGMIISGTYFGPKSEWDALGFEKIFKQTYIPSILVFKDWLGLLGHWAEDLALQIAGGIPAAFASKSLAFPSTDMIPSAGVDNLFKYLDTSDKGTAVWFLIFDLEAGYTNDIPMNATAYVHRDALFYSQSYAINLGRVSDTTRGFVNGINNAILSYLPQYRFGSYPGYVDPTLPNGQEAYWGTNLPRLEKIKRCVDPKDIFHNPQSIKPASGAC